MNQITLTYEAEGVFVYRGKKLAWPLSDCVAGVAGYPDDGQQVRLTKVYSNRKSFCMDEMRAQYEKYRDEILHHPHRDYAVLIYIGKRIRMIALERILHRHHTLSPYMTLMKATSQLGYSNIQDDDSLSIINQFLRKGTLCVVRVETLPMKKGAKQ